MILENTEKRIHVRELQDFEGKESGTCLVIASGPSLSLINHKAVEASGITIVSCNRSYQAFTPGACKYWFSVNPTREIVVDNPSKWLFLQNIPDMRDEYGNQENVCFFHPEFFTVKRNSLVCNQSGLPTLHLCAALGFKEIYMLGFDFGEGPRAYWDGGQFTGEYRSYYSQPLKHHVMMLSRIVDEYGVNYYNMSYNSLINEICKPIEIPKSWRSKGENETYKPFNRIMAEEIKPTYRCPHVVDSKCKDGDSGIHCNKAAAPNCRSLRPLDWEPEKSECVLSGALENKIITETEAFIQNHAQAHVNPSPESKEKIFEKRGPGRPKLFKDPDLEGR